MKTVFVGNPVIADVTVIDAKHIFLLGKNYGTTNLVALGRFGQADGERSDHRKLGRPGSVVTVQRGAAQTTLSCDGRAAAR